MTLGNKIGRQDSAQIVNTEEVKQAELSDLSRALQYSWGNRITECPYYLDIVESSPFSNSNSELRAAGLKILNANQIRIVKKANPESNELWEDLVMVQLPEAFVILERAEIQSKPYKYWRPVCHVRIPPEVEEEHFAGIMKLACKTFLTAAKYRIWR